MSESSGRGKRGGPSCSSPSPSGDEHSPDHEPQRPASEFAVPPSLRSIYDLSLEEYSAVIDNEAIKKDPMRKQNLRIQLLDEKLKRDVEQYLDEDEDGEVDEEGRERAAGFKRSFAEREPFIY